MEVSLPIGQDTAFTRKGSVLANKANYPNVLVSLLIESETKYVREEIFLANRARHLIY